MTKHFAWYPKKIYDLNDGKIKRVWLKRYYKTLDYVDGFWFHMAFIPTEMNKKGIDKKIKEKGYA